MPGLDPSRFAEDIALGVGTIIAMRVFMFASSGGNVNALIPDIGQSTTMIATIVAGGQVISFGRSNGLIMF